jgi:drug efflux transport system permease protein
VKTRVPAIARKEFLHVLRDWRTLLIAFVLPAVLILLFGYAITFDIRDLKLAVADEDRSPASRELVERFTASKYFTLVASASDPEDLLAMLDAGEAQIALSIPKDFGSHIERWEGDTVQVLLDGSESNTATIAAGYVEAILAGLNISRVRDVLSRVGLRSEAIPPVDMQIRVWFNPEMDSTWTIVPGLIAVIMVIIAALLTSLTVVREREFGSLEGLIATPARKHEIILGKMLPYLLLTLIDCVMVAMMGVVVFGVPFAGGLLLFAGTALVFAVAGLSIGLLASVLASSQLLANQIVVLSTVLPSVMLSGFMFPIKSMPQWVQAFTYAVPARYFVRICRDIMLKAQPAENLLRPTIFLVLFGTILLSFAVVRFKKKL